MLFKPGPSLPTVTQEPIRPLALATASAWWTEGWFKIVVALGGLIIVAILVATFIVVGRNSSRKEQVRKYTNDFVISVINPSFIIQFRLSMLT